MQKLKDEISGKKHQIHVLEKRVIGSVEITPHVSNTSEMSQALSKLTAQLTQKTFELEIKSADNRILQEQLQTKIQSQHCLSEHAEMQETIHLLREQLNSVTQQSAEKAVSRLQHCSKEILENDSEKGNGIYSCEEAYVDVNTPTSVMSLNKIFSHEDSKEFSDNFSNTQVLMQAAEMENMKQEMVKVTEEKDGLEALSRKLAEEATYAKELASAAAVELRNLAEEVTRLSYENAKLTGDLAAVKEAFCRSSSQRFTRDLNEKIVNCAQSDGRLRKSEGRMLVEELQKELGVRHQREVVLNAALFEKDQVEGNLRRRLDEAKQREQELENELTNMWMRKSNLENISFERIAEANKPKAKVKNANFPVNGHAGNISSREHSTGKDGVGTFEELEDNYQNERSRCKELESIISRFKVVKRPGSMSGTDFSNSSQGAGTKRSIRDRLGTNFNSNKRQRGESLNALGIDKNDLRFKLMQKKNGEVVDLRERLSRTGQPRESLSRTEQPRERLSRTEQPHERLLRTEQPPPSNHDSRQRVPQPKETNVSWPIPSTRNVDDLPRMDSSRQSYSPWTLDHIKRRSPDRSTVTNPRGLSPFRMEELIQKRSSSGTYDDVRSIPYMRKDLLDSHRPVGTSTYMTKPAMPAGSGKPLPVPSMGPPQMVHPSPGPMPSNIVPKSSYVPEEPQTIDGLLHSLGLGKYAILFKAEEIDMGDLRQMGESDLKELGIPMGPRKKILLAVLPRSKRHL